MLWLEISIILISVKPTLVINVKISHLVRFWTFSGRFCASRGKTFFRRVLNAFSVEKLDQSPITFLLYILYNFIVVIFFSKCACLLTLGFWRQKLDLRRNFPIQMANFNQEQCLNADIWKNKKYEIEYKRKILD